MDAELNDLDKSIKILTDSYRSFLDTFIIHLKRIDEMEKMLGNLRQERNIEQ